MTKEEALSILLELENFTFPVKDKIVFSKSIGGVLTQYTFVYLIKIAYGLDDATQANQNFGKEDSFSIFQKWKDEEKNEDDGHGGTIKHFK